MTQQPLCPFRVRKPNQRNFTIFKNLYVLSMLETMAHEQHFQLFWGSPSLHSESLLSTVLVSAGCSMAFVYFNSIPNAPIVQMQEKDSPLLPPPLPLSLLEMQPQTLPQTLPQSQNLHLTQDQCQGKLHPQLQIPPPSPAPRRPPGESFSRPKNEAHTLTQDAIHYLEWHVLQKQLERLWGMPADVQASQKDFCPPAPNFPQHQWPYKAQHPIALVPVNFPLNNELQKTLERHLRKRLIQHRWGLPHRISHSLSLMEPPDECLEIAESKNTYGLTWIPTYAA
ncbi:LOW QUALITY PROTEIN: spermatogenesis-associated protein 31D3-like [Rhynchocyon petersi]